MAPRSNATSSAPVSQPEEKLTLAERYVSGVAILVRSVTFRTSKLPRMAQ